MKKYFPSYSFYKVLLPGVFLLLSGNSFAHDWKVRSSTLKFEIKNLGSTVEGSFSSMQATILFDPSNLSESSIAAVIDVASIHTGNKTRDKHLREKEYFDESNFKQISFISNEISLTPEKDKYLVKGNLTIKGITREISLTFSFEENEKDGKFSGNLILNRLDYNVGSSSWILGDEVRILFELNTTKTI